MKIFILNAESFNKVLKQSVAWFSRKKKTIDFDWCKFETNQNGSNKKLEFSEIEILPLYAALPNDDQTKVLQPAHPNSRKVILATNIAESSLTIPNIVYVVDSGLCKRRRFDPKTGRTIRQLYKRFS